MNIERVRPLRIIRLRRPPVFASVPERFVPTHVSLEEVDACWSALCARNEKYFDGGLVQVLGTSRNGHGGVSIHVQPCAYRFFAVQMHGLACGVRPLGVKAIVSAGASYLIGRRSRHVAAYPGTWEFVPGGGLENTEDVESELRREFEEEVGSALPAGVRPIAIALLDDPVTRTWDIIYRVQLEATCELKPSFEHDAMCFVNFDALRALTSPSPALTAMLALLPSS